VRDTCCSSWTGRSFYYGNDTCCSSFTLVLCLFAALPCFLFPHHEACFPGFDPTTQFYSLKILTVSQPNYHAEAIFCVTRIEMHKFLCSSYFLSDPCWERPLVWRMGGLRHVHGCQGTAVSKPVCCMTVSIDLHFVRMISHIKKNPLFLRSINLESLFFFYGNWSIILEVPR
jgi:hypothetical protein